MGRKTDVDEFSPWFRDPDDIQALPPAGDCHYRLIEKMIPVGCDVEPLNRQLFFVGDAVADLNEIRYKRIIVHQVSYDGGETWEDIDREHGCSR